MKSPKNALATVPMNKLIWQLGLPMILSMILQAVYNVVDTVFVINSAAATQGNAALTAAFPIQILMIAVGVGTGVGINALLSQKLGENDRETANRVAGNGIVLAVFLYALFLLFAAVGVGPYMRLMSDDAVVVEMGTAYLRICCGLSAGSIGFTVYERFLQATGKTLYSMLAQVAGALCNIWLDYVFVIRYDRGVAGAAWATVIGQFLSLFAAMLFHYTQNHTISGSPRYIRPNAALIRRIYTLGIPAAIMQALLAVMMFLVLQIFKTISDPVTVALMTNTYGIYYKIMQTALFACFGLSNTLITLTSFAYGLKSRRRLTATVQYGLINALLVCLLLTLLFQVCAAPLSALFGLSLPPQSADGLTKADILATCETAIHIATLGYVFMGITVAVQGILQGLRRVYSPLILAALRLVVFVLPFARLFCAGERVSETFWWTFVFSEVLTAVCALAVLKYTHRRTVDRLPDQTE